MFSALQGKLGGTSSTSPDPYPGLHYSRIASRCVHIRSSIASLPLKELHQFFPHLLSNIFGFDHSEGWGLRLFSKTQHGDFHQLLQFLAPHGDLFQLIYKLEAEGFIYEFPVECLPRPSQQALIEGIIPPLYTDKVQLSFAVDNSPTHIFLSAFQYYIFHFAYYLIHTQLSPSRPPINMADTLYTHLLDSYLNYYLPFTGTIPASPTSSLAQGSPLYNLTTPPGFNTSLGSSIGQSPVYKGSEVGGVRFSGGNRMRVSSPYEKSPQYVQSEVFVQVLVEFWLNQNTYNGGRGDLLAQAQNQFTPNEEHLVLLRRVLKQVHYFGCGYSYCSGTTFNSALIPLTDTLRSSLVPAFIQKKLYHFLKYSFKHSPLDMNFRYILELWLTFVQPWRYIDPSKSTAENKESFGSLPKRWRSFVLDNFPFYSSLLMEFFGRCFLADLTVDTLLYRVSKVFSLPGLMGFIEHGESLLLDPDSSLSSSHLTSLRSSPSLSLSSSSIKAVFVDCVGPSSDYVPVFGQDTLDAIRSLLFKVCHSKTVISRKVSPSGTPGSPASHQSPSTTLTPPPSSQPTHAPTLQPPKRSLLKRLWRSLMDALSDEPYNPTSGSPTPASDPRKLVNFLETTATNLSTAFKLPIPKVTLGENSVLGSAVPLGATPLMFPGHTPPLLPPPTLEPDYLQGTNRLSPQGKMQVIQGLRKCSSMNVDYRGDPLLQPIRSYENATLVRLFHVISSHLNEKFAVQLAAVGTGQGLLSKLLLQLLAPPPPGSHDSPILIQDSLEPPATPVSRVTRIITYPDDVPSVPPTPRINLRPLGSYYTLTYVFLAVLFVWLFSVPPFYCLLILFCFILVYCIVGHCLYGAQRYAKKLN